MKFLKVSAVAAAIAFGVSLTAAMAHDSTDQLLEQSRVDAMQATTQAFLATLDADQRAMVMASLEDTAARTGWSNLPVNMAPRFGMAVADMTAGQRRALHAMMASALSSQGYLKTTTIIWHEDVLHQIAADLLAAMPDEDPRKAQGLTFIENYDSEKFFVSVFGDPASQNWGWTVTGHHYASNFTVADGKIAFTPLFLGANPQVVPEGRYAGWRILQHEADRAFALLGSLDASQLKEAVVSAEVDGGVFAGPGNNEDQETALGMMASSLNPLQRRLLDGVIEEYLGDASDEAAARQREIIEADGPDALYFAWWGPTDDPAARYMFRVQGPSILIDYIRENSADGGFNHVHSVARDPSNDYGAEWLNIHYKEAHRD